MNEHTKAKGKAMNGCAYEYRFKGSVEMSAVEDSLLVAVIAAEAIHGRAVVNLDADFDLDETGRICHIDANSGVGRDIARIFVGLLAHDVGEDRFSIIRDVPKVAVP
jgi:hypothetical protein